MSIPIYFGTYHNRKTKGGGVWYCPNCETQTPYKQKELMMYCHICFVPICCAPEMEYVKCKQCQREFEQAFLEGNEAVEQRCAQLQIYRHQVFQKVMLRAMILVMKANGQESRSQEIAIQHVMEHEFQENSSIQLEMEQMDPETTMVSLLEAWLKTGKVNDSQKYKFAKGLVVVATADGDIEREEAELLADVARELVIPIPTMKKLIHDELHGEDHD